MTRNRSIHNADPSGLRGEDAETLLKGGPRQLRDESSDAELEVADEAREEAWCSCCFIAEELANEIVAAARFLYNNNSKLRNKAPGGKSFFPPFCRRAAMEGQPWEGPAQYGHCTRPTHDDVACTHAPRAAASPPCLPRSSATAPAG